MGLSDSERISMICWAVLIQSTRVTYRQTDSRTDGRKDRRNCRGIYAHSWARTRGAQLWAGYTVNTYSKLPLYDATKGNDVWFSQRAGLFSKQKTSTLWKPDVNLFIARTDTRRTDTRQKTRLTTNQPASQPKWQYPAESWEIACRVNINASTGWNVSGEQWRVDLV